MTPRKATGLPDANALKMRLWAKVHEQLRGAINKTTANDRRTLREAARELRVIAGIIEEIGDLE